MSSITPNRVVEVSLNDSRIVEVAVSGPQGPIGYYYTPHLSSSGILSWTNNGNLNNPSSLDILGKLDTLISSTYVKITNIDDSITVATDNEILNGVING